MSFAPLGEGRSLAVMRVRLKAPALRHADALSESEARSYRNWFFLPYLSGMRAYVLEYNGQMEGPIDRLTGACMRFTE